MEINLETVSELVKESKSYREVYRKFDLKRYSIKINEIKLIIEENNIDISHFTSQRPNYKTTNIIKNCPVCHKKFLTGLGKEERTVCSKSCSNTYFRSGTNNGNWKDGEHKTKYRDICFHYHKKSCIICAENKIIEVHHLDGNNKNNAPENLIPLCPTHHQYWHSSYRYEVESIILNYLENWKKNNS